MELLMNTAAIKKSTIIKALSRIPDNSLDNVEIYIESLLINLQSPSLKNQSLKGIWKDAGFENILEFSKNFC